jgi:hypothetical protein
MKKALIMLQVFLLLGMVLSIAGCSKNSSSSVSPDSELAAKTEDSFNNTLISVSTSGSTASLESSANSDDADSTAEDLKGTCPRGNHCGSPHCPLWSNLNNDDACDRAA